MINLLPPEIKSGYSYARSNVILRQWVVIFLISLVGLGAIATFGLLTIHQSSIHYTKLITASDADFKKENYALTQKRVEEITGSFKLVVKVLGQEVLFSELIKQIGASMPSNANLIGLNISQTTGGLDITANATNYATATQVQVNLADPKNKIFSKADIVNISCSTKNDEGINATKYPCVVNIRALFAKDNPFLFINNKSVKP